MSIERIKSLEEANASYAKAISDLSEALLLQMEGMKILHERIKVIESILSAKKEADVAIEKASKG